MSNCHVHGEHGEAVDPEVLFLNVLDIFREKPKASKPLEVVLLIEALERDSIVFDLPFGVAALRTFPTNST